MRMPSRAAARTSAVTPALPPDQAKSGVDRPATRSMSLDRAERTGPTGSGSSEWKTTANRVIPSTSSS